MPRGADMSRISMIHHVNLQITDRERTREWYERVLGAEFLDRGPALNKRQLQLRIGTGEIHTSDTDNPVKAPGVHFVVGVENWDDMLVHLEQVGVPYSKSAGGAFSGTGGNDSRQGRREDTDEHYTYISDPDDNLIELVNHPRGLEDSEGESVYLVRDSKNVRWTQIPGFIESEKSMHR